MDAAHSLSPGERGNFDIPSGKQGNKSFAITFDTEKKRRILGMKFRTMEEMTRDFLADFQSRVGRKS